MLPIPWQTGTTMFFVSAQNRFVDARSFDAMYYGGGTFREHS